MLASNESGAACSGEEVDAGHVDGALVEVFFEADCTRLPPEVPHPPAAPPPEPEL